MKLIYRLLLTLPFFFSSILSHPLDLPFRLDEDEIQTLQRRQSGIVDTTGVPGAVQPRLEVRQMQTEHPSQFTLLVLAMQKFMAAPSSQATGYYKIAGIHGVPQVNYNGVGPCQGCNTADGYCTHDSVLFPAWHRAYMALFEQEFVRIAKTIASIWPVSGQPTTRAQMVAAANAIRLPYWDWAAIPPNGGPCFPTAFSSPTVTVNGPNGKETIANPLYSYHFASTSGLVYSPFVSWPNTLRYPTSDSSTATSNDPGAVTAFNNVRPSLQDQLYQLFTTCSEYLYFSNDEETSSTAPCSNSIEGIHNTVHTTSGGIPTNSTPVVGHMYYLAEAGFDPLFYFHHAMVDRATAMWQTLYPGSWGASQTAPHNTWTIEQGSTQGPNSPLTPFYQSGSTFWTTDSIRNWTQFHYTYPEFIDSDGSASAIASYVNKLYGPSATATAGSSKRTAAPEPILAPVAAAPEEEETTEKRSTFTPPKGAFAANGSSYQYIANIKTPRYALAGSYWIFLFLGDPENSDPSTWINDANLIGPMGVLSDPGMQGKDLLITGSIPLTRSLTKHLVSGMLTELTEGMVGPYLQKMLQWRILGPEGEEVDPGSLPGFLVEVYATTASESPGQEETETRLPMYSDFFALPIATHGKSGGLLGGWVE